MSKNLYIRDLNTREAIKTMPMSNSHPKHIERVMMGLLRQMDTDRFYIDDSEFDEDGSK